MAACAVTLAICAGFTTSFGLVMTQLWFLLFFGGAICPGATGLILTSVPPALRPLSSAMSMLVFNVCGYAAGTLVPGLYMQYWMARGVAYVTVLDEGFRLVLLWGGFALIFISLSACHSKRELDKQEEEERKLLGVSEDYVYSDSKSKSKSVAEAHVQRDIKCSGDITTANDTLGNDYDGGENTSGHMHAEP